MSENAVPNLALCLIEIREGSAHSKRHRCACSDFDRIRPNALVSFHGQVNSIGQSRSARTVDAE